MGDLPVPPPETIADPTKPKNRRLSWWQNITGQIAATFMVVGMVVFLICLIVSAVVILAGLISTGSVGAILTVLGAGAGGIIGLVGYMIAPAPLAAKVRETIDEAF